MTKAGTTTETRGVDADAAPPSPVVLNDVESGGAVRFGGRVRVMILIMDDGRRVRIELPLAAVPGQQRPAKDWTKTKPGRAILATLAREGRPLKGETLAKLADYAYNGSFREALSGLEKQGEVRRDDDDEGYILSD